MKIEICAREISLSELEVNKLEGFKVVCRSITQSKSSVYIEGVFLAGSALLNRLFTKF